VPLSWVFCENCLSVFCEFFHSMITVLSQWEPLFFRGAVVVAAFFWILFCCCRQKSISPSGRNPNQQQITNISGPKSATSTPTKRVARPWRENRKAKRKLHSKLISCPNPEKAHHKKKPGRYIGPALLIHHYICLRHRTYISIHAAFMTGCLVGMN